MVWTSSRPRLWLALLLALHFLVDLTWHGLDRQLPDGDEAGHLGAIELYRSVIEDRGLLQAAREAFTSTSEYPPLFALAEAVPLAVLEVRGPFPRGVAVLQAIWSTLTLLAVAGMARTLAATGMARTLAATGGGAASPPGMGSSRSDGAGLSPEGIALLAAAAYATFPLPAALGREAMIEPFLTLWVALTLWAALKSDGFTRTLPTVALALAVAAGGLTKQTFPLYVAGPLALVALTGLVRKPGRALPRLGLAALVAVPLPAWWLELHWKAQQGYGLSSVAAKGQADGWAHLAYYPAVFAGNGVGLLWTAPLALALVVLLRRRQWWAPVALLLVLAFLTLVPKKYPRLLVPALPLTAATLALGLGALQPRGLRRAVAGGAVAAGVVQHVALSFPVGPLPDDLGLWEPGFFHDIDPGCPQVWIRRASGDDLGFDAVLAALETTGQHQGGIPLLFIDEPEIPCSYETTFNYSYHLAEYARRHGHELDDLPVIHADPARFDQVASRARLVVSLEPWCEDASGPGDAAPGAAGAGETGTTRAEDPTCRIRYAFEAAGTFTARSDRLHFTLHFYRRRFRT